MEEISKNIGTVHDIDQFSFIAELEDFFFKHQNQDVEIELLQGKNTTEGLLNVRATDKNGNVTVLNHDDSIKLIEQVFSIKTDEVYLNFAGHIVYLIVLK
ncbi:hypothetical protein [Metabacillus malikii]|uniref:Uncharacterized protein n=1 Tax=Metabacillus malikii TaxID=1504265 RepID=A0ABT9ZHL3_9BACI|nr:hypothetical protein [Metabacillus malikii]MDQ0231773.1 hypothetical protein [Metabacillus malikii]